MTLLYLVVRQARLKLGLALEYDHERHVSSFGKPPKVLSVSCLIDLVQLEGPPWYVVAYGIFSFQIVLLTLDFFFFLVKKLCSLSQISSIP